MDTNARVLTASRTVTAVPAWAPGVLHDHSLPTQIFPVQLIDSIISVSQIIEFHKTIPRDMEGKGITGKEPNLKYLYSKATCGFLQSSVCALLQMNLLGIAECSGP